jgi:hypothetical protein
VQDDKDVTVPVILAVVLKEMSDGDDGNLNCSLTLVQRIFARTENDEVEPPTEGGEPHMFTYQVNDQVGSSSSRATIKSSWIDIIIIITSPSSITCPGLVIIGLEATAYAHRHDGHHRFSHQALACRHHTAESGA